VPGVSTGSVTTHHQLIDLKPADAGAAHCEATDGEAANGKGADGEGTECERAKRQGPYGQCAH
jgi:hypothetical protein